MIDMLLTVGFIAGLLCIVYYYFFAGDDEKSAEEQPHFTYPSPTAEHEPTKAELQRRMDNDCIKRL